MSAQPLSVKESRHAPAILADPRVVSEQLEYLQQGIAAGIVHAN